MNCEEFIKNPEYSHKLYAVAGGEKYFYGKIRDAFINHFIEYEVQEVDASEEIEDFYTKIESNGIFSEPKLIFIYTDADSLRDKKNFDQYVLHSGDATKYVVFGEYKPKIEALCIDCSKIKDNARDVTPYINKLLKEAGLQVSSKIVSLFYFLYRNDLQVISNEIEKLRLLNQSMKKPLLDISDVLNVLSPSEHKDIFKFSNNFMHRKLKGALNALPEQDFLSHIGNIFSMAEKLYVSKTSKLDDVSIVKNYKFNNYYYLHSIKPLSDIWTEEELKNLIGEMNDLRVKFKESKLPIRQSLKQAVIRYCK